MQSTEVPTFVMNRSMSDLVAGQTGDGALELGFGGERTQPSVIYHFRAGRYRNAAETLASHYRLYISITAFVVMFGMTVAGLWLEIASQQQTVV